MREQESGPPSGLDHPSCLGLETPAPVEAPFSPRQPPTPQLPHLHLHSLLSQQADSYGTTEGRDWLFEGLWAGPGSGTFLCPPLFSLVPDNQHLHMTAEEPVIFASKGQRPCLPGNESPRGIPET